MTERKLLARLFALLGGSLERETNTARLESNLRGAASEPAVLECLAHAMEDARQALTGNEQAATTPRGWDRIGTSLEQLAS